MGLDWSIDDLFFKNGITGDPQSGDSRSGDPQQSSINKTRLNAGDPNSSASDKPNGFAKGAGGALGPVLPTNASHHFYIPDLVSGQKAKIWCRALVEKIARESPCDGGSAEIWSRCVGRGLEWWGIGVQGWKASGVALKEVCKECPKKSWDGLWLWWLLCWQK